MSHPLPRPDEIRALRARYTTLLGYLQAEIDGVSRDGSLAVHEAQWRGALRRIERLIDGIETCAAAVEAEDADARRQIERLGAAIRAFEPDAAALRGDRLEPLPALPWSSPPGDQPRRRPVLRVLRD